MTAYCLGFVFDDSLEEVLLIKKVRSAHAGKWNGVGGSLLDIGGGGLRESYLDAMIRECFEETGLDIHNWQEVCYVTSPYTRDDARNWNIRVFAVSTVLIKSASSRTDEKVEIFDRIVIGDMITAPYTRMLIEAARDRLMILDTRTFHIQTE